MAHCSVKGIINVCSLSWPQDQQGKISDPRQFHLGDVQSIHGIPIQQVVKILGINFRGQPQQTTSTSSTSRNLYLKLDKHAQPKPTDPCRLKVMLRSPTLTLNEVCDEAIKLNLYARFAFLQEMGCDLIRYNRIRRPTKWMLQQQNEFDLWLPALHRATKDINFSLGVRTPWVFDSIYKHDHQRRFYPWSTS